MPLVYFFRHFHFVYVQWTFPLHPDYLSLQKKKEIKLVRTAAWSLKLGYLHSVELTFIQLTSLRGRHCSIPQFFDCRIFFKISFKSWIPKNDITFVTLWISPCVIKEVLSVQKYICRYNTSIMFMHVKVSNFCFR